MPRQRIFISYRRDDGAGHAGRLEADLTRHFGRRVFMDVADIAAGEDFVRALDRELESCGVALALIGPRWLAALQQPRDGTDYVRLELSRVLKHPDVSVIPVLVQGGALPPAAQLPDELKELVQRQAVTLRDDRWKDDVAHLAESVRAILGVRRVPLWLGLIALAAFAALVLGGMSLISGATGPFDRLRAREIVLTATRKAVDSCRGEPGAHGECPVLFEFPPSGKATQVYYPVGYCDFKGTPYGDCILEELQGTRIPRFDNTDVAEVQLAIQHDERGQAKVIVEY